MILRVILTQLPRLTRSSSLSLSHLIFNFDNLNGSSRYTASDSRSLPTVPVSASSQSQSLSQQHVIWSSALKQEITHHVAPCPPRKILLQHSEIQNLAKIRSMYKAHFKDSRPSFDDVKSPNLSYFFSEEWLGLYASKDDLDMLLKLNHCPVSLPSSAGPSMRTRKNRCINAAAIIEKVSRL